jgi:hypothetical protein
VVFGAGDCARVVPAWFWSSRCNAAPHDLRLGASNQAVFGELCQHGNLHLDFFDASLMQRVDAQAAACGWAQCDRPCQERFSRSAAIRGRGLQVGRLQV